MTKLQNVVSNFFKFQTVKTSLLAVILVVVCAPLFAQTVNTVSTGVWYNDGVSASTDNTDYALYCNGTGPGMATDGTDVGANRSFVYAPYPASNRNQNDPWVSSGLIEYDQPYPAPTTENNYPNHCLGLCASFACSNLPVGQTTYSVAFPLQRITFDVFKYYNGKNPKNPDEVPSIRSIDVYPAQDVSKPEQYTCGSYHCSNAGQDDNKNSQVAECLGAHWICNGTSSGLKSAKTVKCMVAVVEGEGLGWSCIDQNSSDGISYSNYVSCRIGSDGKTVTCDARATACPTGSTCTQTCQLSEENGGACISSGTYGITNLYIPASSAQSYCWPSTMTFKKACLPNDAGVPTIPGTQTCNEFKPLTSFSACKNAGSSATDYPGCCTYAGHSDCVVFDGNGAETNEQLSFCTGWDGFYEMAGEFGKSNGQFGFRATAYTNVPSDGVIADRIEIEETGVYPGHNGATQIPIQIDVTNVHTVRSTPSLVGTITPVSAQPYTFTYRLSKDADVRIAIFDASTKDISAYGPTSGTQDTTHTSQAACEAAGNVWLTKTGSTTAACYVADSVVYGSDSGNFANGGNYEDATNVIVRTLVDWQPRTGEGMKGTDKDTQISDFDSWDGRHDEGFLLPAGNYIASIQAKSQDEWPGIDFSRAVTRQVSLDPLKLTDVQVVGLNKKSTAYATISYVPTEPSTVYWEVYTPGTTFTGPNGVSEILTDSSKPTGTGPTLATTSTNATGTLVYRSAEQKSGRMNYTQRWDGTCQVPSETLLPYVIANGTAYPTGAKKADGTALTGTCSTTGGCLYYMTSTTGGCSRIYAYKEKMANGATCNTQAGCTERYAYGAPLPDGNYVYVLWAEIPYNGSYVNAIGSTDSKSPKFRPNQICSGTDKEINNQCFTGVKTLKYTVGTLELERGLVGITMQPASYATLGSSPTAYGLDPFVFKYSLDRDAQVIATVENTAGVVVKHLTLEAGEPNVSQQLNTLTWDGRDDQGRMVYPGTYMFRVKAMDAMFPAQSNEAIEVFPVDMYRVVDLATTDVYGDSNAKATISYHLSKTMNAQVNIYNKDVVIPDYNSSTGDYNSATVTATYNASNTNVADLTTAQTFDKATYGLAVTATSPTDLTAGSSKVEYLTDTSVTPNISYRNTWTVVSNYSIAGRRDLNADLTNLNADPTSPNHNNEPYATNAAGNRTYTLYLKQEVLNVNTDTQAWPPRICNKEDHATQNGDSDIFAAGGYVDPALVNQLKRACIYVNDKTFTNYPANAAQAASGAVDVRLQPIHTFDRSSLRVGDDAIVMEEWDALYFYNPTPSAERHSAAEIQKCQEQNEKANCPYEMVPDGQYPFFISARSNEPFNRYYYSASQDGTNGSAAYNAKGFKGNYTIPGEPFRRGAEFATCSTTGTGTGTSACVDNIDVQQEDYLYASDKVVSKINVTRGPVYFLDGSTAVFPNAPQLFNASSTTLTFIPPYEINFSISRAATVEVAIVALEAGMCSPVTDNVLSSKVNVYESRTNVAGDICKFLSTMTIANTGHFDANAIRKIYWDGTDHTGNYVKPGIYEVRLTARNYPDAGLYEPTVKSITLNADLLKVFDLLETDSYAIAERGQNMKIGYQISVPMKVAIQIFKPGTTIYDYSKGTLRNPTTGREVQDIREVLVRSIVGIRPGTTLIEEVWDGLDYAGQEVPDGVYPFRFVTSLDSAAIDSVTGEILFGNDTDSDPMKWKIQRVADTYQYQTLHKATIAVGDGRFVCDDWKKTVFFYPNPLNDASKGTLEITKMPVPGTVSIKYFNLAGDLVRNADYTCVDANNYQTTMGSHMYFQPDNNVSDVQADLSQINNVRNAALRCKWDRTNQHGKKVARGVYFGLVDFKAYNGREHCQKVVKILIP